MTVKELIKQLKRFEDSEKPADVLIYDGDCGAECPIDRVGWEYRITTGEQRIIIVPED